MFNTVKFSSASNIYSGGLEKSLVVMAVSGRRGKGNYSRVYNYDKQHPQPNPQPKPQLKIKTNMEHLIELFYLTTFPN